MQRLGSTRKIQDRFLTLYRSFPCPWHHHRRSLSVTLFSNIMTNVCTTKASTTTSIDDSSDPIIINADESVSMADLVVDNPCWGSPTQCGLIDLLTKVSKGSSIIYDTLHYLALNKPPDLRMDGPYPATVHKLLTYWYPSPSLLAQVTTSSLGPPNDENMSQSLLHHHDGAVGVGHDQSTALLDTISHLHGHHHLKDNFLRPCHQLDYATSGVLLVAKTQEGAAHVSKLLEDRHEGISKSYLAVVVGDVERVLDNLPIWTTGRTDGTSGTTYRTVEDDEGDLKEYLQRLEGDYRRARSKFGKQKRRDGASASVRDSNPPSRGTDPLATCTANVTFAGYQPAHSMFHKWKAQLAVQERNEKSLRRDGNDGTDSTGGSNDTARPAPKRRRKPPNPLSDDDWTSIWKPVRETITTIVDDSRCDVNGADTSDVNWQQLEWKQVGRQYPALKDAIKEAADIHNFLLRRALSEKGPHRNENGSTVDASDQCTTELPTIFRLPEPNSINNNKEQDKTFYVFCPLGQHPEEFPMYIPTDVAQQQRNYPPTLPTASPANYSIHGSVSSTAPILDFKPSLTKCTILQRALFRPDPCCGDVMDGHHDKVREIVVTKIRLSPITGRRHQLRVHMSLAGHPILGDITYGQQVEQQQDPTDASKEGTNTTTTTTTTTTPVGGGDRGTDSCSRMCLHAQSLELPSLLGETGPWKVMTPDPFIVRDDGYLEVTYG